MHWIDPASLPETKGKVSRFLLNPHGELDGLLLSPATLVHFPPHMGRQVARHISLGSKVRIRAVKPRNAALLAAVSLTAADGTVITDEGPNKAHHAKPAKPARKPGEVAGRVLLSLYGPKGELRGALLENGPSLRLAPDAAAELTDYLAPGAMVRGWGKVVTTKFGSTMDLDEIAMEPVGA